MILILTPHNDSHADSQDLNDSHIDSQNDLENDPENLNDSHIDPENDSEKLNDSQNYSQNIMRMMLRIEMGLIISMRMLLRI